MKRAIFPVAVILLAGAAAVAASCNNSETSSSQASSSSGSGSGGSGGAPGLTSMTPKGCSFSIATRPEYEGFALGSAVSSATPNIRRVRLGLGGNVAVGAAGRADPSTTMGFAWQTDDGTFASDVAWGADPDPAKWPAQNRTQGVTWLTPAGTIGALGPARMHEAHVCGLTPATTYYYRVGGGAAGSEVWSDVYSFTTTPSDTNATVRLGLTGDSRGEQGDAWRLTQRRMKLAGVDLQLFSGDAINFATDQGEWEQWLDVAWKDTDNKPLTLANLLMISAHGNHENHTSLYFGNMVLPQEQGKYAPYAELFFSFDVGPMHIVVVDDSWIADTAQDPGYQGVLTEWLDADLAAAVKNRVNVPWIVTLQHRSEFSSSNHGMDSDVLAARKYFVPIWDKYHVDMAIRGHDHNYERSKPVTGPWDNPTVHPGSADGTIYVVCAGTGAPAYTPGMSPFTHVSHGFKTGGALGVYAILTVDKSTLKIEAHDLLMDATDPIFDTVTLPFIN